MALNGAATDRADLQRYDNLVAKLYGDEDIPPATRELALALAWARFRDPERHAREWSRSARVACLLGYDELGLRRDIKLFAQDAPRYEPPRSAWDPGPCVGPRLRPYRPRRVDVASLPEKERNRTVCGARGRIKVEEPDVRTGQIRAVHWFCSRHRAEAARVREQVETAGDVPEPVPNTGGYLPRYFNEEWLRRAYAWARPHWVPPRHGLCVDDWPTASTPVTPRRPRLYVVGGPGEPTGT
ncbi:hypothetical protein [Amycolatopsis sp. NPDC058986]|uniref:hypothetical protein n=1 Tax=unclassified Amycolatopsis TaxID=2618356 RepID=UPI00366F9059